MQPIWKDTQNYTAGPDGTTLDRIVIPYIVGTLAAADATFASSSAGVSAHDAIDEGALHQHVSEQNTAWHAGDFPMTQRSIGIEHSADPNRAPSSSTYNTSIELCTTICQNYGLNPQTQIIPHSSVVSTACPGTVDLQRIRDGVSAKL